MKTKTNYVLVGLFVLTLSVALIAGVLWLSSGGAGRAYDEYLVYMTESVSGLSQDSTVKYYGVNVGHVRQITLDADDQRRVRLLLEIEEGTPIHEDTVASLETQGLTGLSYINLSGGSPEYPPLQQQAGESHPVIASEPSLWGRLDQSLSTLVDNLIEASRRLNQVLSDENQQLMSETLDNIKDLTAMLAGRSSTFDETVDHVAGAAKHLHDTSALLPRLVGKLETTAGALDEMAGEISETALSIRQTVEARGSELKGLTTRTLPELGEMVHELRLAAENFRRFSEELERNPGVLIQGGPAPRRGPGE